MFPIIHASSRNFPYSTNAIIGILFFEESNISSITIPQKHKYVTLDFFFMF